MSRVSRRLGYALLLISITSSFAYASKLSDELEQKITQKDWRGVHAIINELPSNSSNDREYTSKIDASTRAVMSFIRYCDLLVGASDQEVISLRKTVETSYNQIPRKLPFSKNFIDTITDLKTKVNLKYAQIDESNLIKSKMEQTRLAEAKTKRMKMQQIEDKRRKTKLAELEEWRARNKEEDRIKEIQIEQVRNDARKEKEVAMAYQLAQSSAMESTEYLRFESLCRLCQAVDDKNIIEKMIAKDARYAKKYGVANLSRLDRKVQQIKIDDDIIKLEKARYLDLSKKSFKPSECKNNKMNDCDFYLQELSTELTKKILAGSTTAK